MPAHLDWLQNEIYYLKEAGLYSNIRSISSPQGAWLVIDGKRVLNFCSNNYLGLANHPHLVEAAKKAIDQYGVGPGAVRIISGTTDLHIELERRLAQFKGVDAAITFQSGFTANLGTIPALVGKDDAIFSDELNHASIIDGSRLSGAKVIRYAHCDAEDLERQLKEQRVQFPKVLVITDGVFSMDGDLAPLRELAELKREFGALLMVDDAHGTGVLGETGRGSAEMSGVMSDIDIHMGTLGKALGSFGAYAAARADIIDWLINSSRSFIFSTSLPPAVLGASLAALEVVDSSEGLQLRRQLAANTSRFRQGLEALGLRPVEGETQIVPLLVGDAAECVEASRRLLEQGVFVQAIRPPTVPAGTSRLRFTLMATHTDEDVDRALAALSRALSRGM